MGACLCKGQKELESTPAVPGTELQPNTEGQPIVKDGHRPANGTLTDSKSRSSYNIGELATSSLLGLVATIKEHITKPTAMAQGRVAHLIEWKGWASGGGATYSSAMWGGAMGSWAGAGAGLQEDQQLYSDLTDEIKEARFAAGVAQQFALAEATLGAWSCQDIPDGSNSSYAPLQDSDGILLSRYFFSPGDVGAPQHCYSSDSGPMFPPVPAHSQSPNACWQPDAELQPQDQRTSRLDGSIRHADSSSLSEDEVFYD
ncbi:protein FAM131C isoform X1 [Scleropages formosus]|uniref:Family with sequence similarity 131 member C n=1 Tax=Scleropages formosus TaxID=113540 RepID=A0A8C9V110_SCLFO|nr:protein FAM131C isoform X1 [Scleropages formosus]